MKFAARKGFTFTIRGKLLAMCLALLLIPSLVVSVLSYQTAIDSINEGGEKRLKNSVKSTVALIAMLEQQIQSGSVDRKDAEEFVRIMMLGPKSEDGKRPINKSIDLGESGYPFALDDNGIMLSHPSLEGQSLHGLTNGKGELVLDSENKQPVVEAFLAKAKSGGGVVFYDWLLPDSEQFASKITYVERDPDWGWTIAAGAYMQDFNAGARQIVTITLITLSIMLVAGAAVIIIFTRRMTKPILEVSQMASQVAKGDLQVQPIVCRSKDETGRMAESFNEMVIQLRTLVYEVGKSVDQVAASSEELMASGEQTSQASEHIALTIQQVAEGAERQSESAEQSYRTIHDMSASVQQIASSTEQVAYAARKTSNQAEEGSKALGQAVVRMETIQQSFNSLSEAVQGLGVRSGEIVRMVQVITDIASQTNLLALNASIEAARAGEHGRGFAVVAGEVRKLAEQTNESSKQITSIVQAVGSETQRVVIAMTEAGDVVKNGITAVEEAGSMFHAIRDEVIQVASQVDEVSQATSGIAAGTEQVMQAIQAVVGVAVEGASGAQSVSAAAEEQTASMEEIAAASTMLAHMAEELQTQINKFKL